MLLVGVEDAQPIRTLQIGIVLELVDGRVLRECLATMTSNMGLSISLDIGRALEYLHARGPPIVHGGLNPNNIMIQQVQGKVRAKIIDFGLARMVTLDAPPPGGALQGTRAAQKSKADAHPMFGYIRILFIFVFHGTQPTAHDWHRARQRNLERSVEQIALARLSANILAICCSVGSQGLNCTI